MTWELGWTIAGLAALDSLNPATLVAISLILLGSRRRPIAEALGFVLGAFVTVFLIGLALYVGAEAAASSITGALTWLRRGAFGLAALVLFVSAARSLRVRHRPGIGLPDWFTPITAAGLCLASCSSFSDSAMKTGSLADYAVCTPGSAQTPRSTPVQCEPPPSVLPDSRLPRSPSLSERRLPLAFNLGM